VNTVNMEVLTSCASDKEGGSGGAMEGLEDAYLAAIAEAGALAREYRKAAQGSKNWHPLGSTRTSRRIL
jgi:hypothetical protein